MRKPTPTIKLGYQGIAGVELPFVYEIKKSVQQKEYIEVDGFPLPPENGVYFHPDRFSAVRWNLFENEGQKIGIPKYFRIAVLLNRSEAGDARFTVKVTIKVRVSWFHDMVETVKTFLGLGRKDYQPIFNPKLSPMTDRFTSKLDDLGEGDNLEDEVAFLLFRKRVDATPGQRGRKSLIALVKYG